MSIQVERQGQAQQIMMLPVWQQLQTKHKATTQTQQHPNKLDKNYRRATRKLKKRETVRNVMPFFVDITKYNKVTLLALLQYKKTTSAVKT